MREWLLKANGLNPQFRKVCGFQPPYAADADMMQKLLVEVPVAEEFYILYSTKEVEIYTFRICRKNSTIKYFDIRFIASLIGYEAWIVVSGLLAVNRINQLDRQIRAAKVALIKAINDQWGIDLMLKG